MRPKIPPRKRSPKRPLFDSPVLTTRVTSTDQIVRVPPCQACAAKLYLEEQVSHLNAIENAWAFLCARLTDTRPPQREWREAFVGRLRNAVAWVNANHGATLQRVCGNQRRRALAVKANKGDMTKW